MKDIKDLLKDSPFSGEPTAPCPHCGRHVLTLAGKWAAVDCAELDAVPEECGCPGAIAERDKKKAAAERAVKNKADADWRMLFSQLREEANIPANWEQRRMSEWQRSTNARETAWNAVKNAGLAIRGKVTAQGAKRSICLAGGVGAGKTFLLSCFAVDLLRCAVRIRWSNVSDFLREVRSSFSRGLSEVDIIRKYTAAPVLFFDDLGKERPSDWGCEQLFSVINSRYDAGLPVMVSTNYSLAELVQRLTPKPDASGYADDTTARAICDRLRAMCEFVVLDGKSRRG